MKTMHDDELKEEYTESDLKVGVRGKYYAAYQKSHNVVRLDPEVSAAFPDEESVNAALLSLIRIARASTGTQSGSYDAPDSGAQSRTE